MTPISTSQDPAGKPNPKGNTLSETPSAPAVTLDEFGQMAKDRLRSSIEQHNTLASRVKAATGDPQALLDNLRETYTEGDAGKITAAIEDLDNKREALFAKRDEILKPIVASMVEDAKAGVGDAEQQAADLLKTIKAGQKYLSDLYGEGAIEDLPKVVGKRAASSGSGGTGQRRVRGFDVYIDGTLATAADAQGVKKSNLAAAAKALGVDTESLRDSFFSAAGSEDSKAWPAKVEFDVTVTEGEGDDAKSVTKHLVCKKQVTATPGATEAVAGKGEGQSQPAA